MARALTRQSASQAARFRLGLEAEWTNDSVLALDHYRAVLAMAAPGSDAWLDAAYRAGSLLVADHRVRDVEEGARLLESFVAARPRDQAAHYLLGEALAMLGDFDGAERIWTRGLDLGPDRSALTRLIAKLPLDRAHAAAKQGDSAAVIEAVERSAASDRPAELWLLYGDALAAHGRTDEAGSAWSQAMTLEPIKGMRRRFRSVGLPYPAD